MSDNLDLAEINPLRQLRQERDRQQRTAKRELSTIFDPLAEALGLNDARQHIHDLEKSIPLESGEPLSDALSIETAGTVNRWLQRRGPEYAKYFDYFQVLQAYLKKISGDLYEVFLLKTAEGGDFEEALELLRDALGQEYSDPRVVMDAFLTHIDQSIPVATGRVDSAAQATGNHGYRDNEDLLRIRIPREMRQLDSLRNAHAVGVEWKAAHFDSLDAEPA